MPSFLRDPIDERVEPAVPNGMKIRALVDLEARFMTESDKLPPSEYTIILAVRLEGRRRGAERSIAVLETFER